MMGQKKKGKRNYYHRLLFINRPLPLSSSHLNGFIERCELRKSRTNSLSRVFSRFERDEQLVIGNENLVECVCLSSKFFPPLVFPALVFKKGKNSRGVGDDLDIPSPRPVVSWKFTLTSTKDLCAFHRVRARKRKFDRVWSWMYSNDLEYLRPFLVGQGASWFRSYTFHTFSLSLCFSHSLSLLVNKKRIQFFPPSLSLFLPSSRWISPKDGFVTIDQRLKREELAVGKFTRLAGNWLESGRRGRDRFSTWRSFMNLKDVSPARTQAGS